MNPVNVMDISGKHSFYTRLLTTGCSGPFFDGCVISIISACVARSGRTTQSDDHRIGAHRIGNIYK